MTDASPVTYVVIVECILCVMSRELNNVFRSDPWYVW
jgi:hypothetical protein